MFDDDDDDDDSLLRVYVTRTLKQLWATMVTGLLGACTPSGSALLVSSVYFLVHIY